MSNSYAICTSCGYNGHAQESGIKGSFLFELALWLCFLLPGIIYTIWRLSTRQTVCPKCGGKALIPIDSPIGRKMLYESEKSKHGTRKAAFEDPVDKWEREQGAGGH